MFGFKFLILFSFYAYNYNTAPLHVFLLVGIMNTGDGYSHCLGTNGKFCVTVSPVSSFLNFPISPSYQPKPLVVL